MSGRREGRGLIGVLASGSGTILAGLLEAGLPVTVVVVDRQCGAEEVATRHGVPVEVALRPDFTAAFDRESYTAEVVEVLRSHFVDLVAMAGFGTVLSPLAFDAYPGRIVNTHPALLPHFKGWHAVADAIRAGVAETGCTVHLATPALDEGPVLAQQSVPVLPGDTVETLHERIKAVERRIYPDALWRLLGELPRDVTARAGTSR